MAYVNPSNNLMMDEDRRLRKLGTSIQALPKEQRGYTRPVEGPVNDVMQRQAPQAIAPQAIAPQAQQMQQRQLAQAPQPQVSNANVAKTPQQILEELSALKQQNAVSSLQQAIEKARVGFQTERANLAPVVQEQRRQVGVEDTMSRQALANMRAQQGLSGSGAVGQDVIAQNVIQSGRLGQIATEEARNLADIGRREQTAEQDFQFAISNAKTQEDIRLAEQKFALAKEAESLAREDKLRAEGFAREDRLTAEERAYRERIRAEDFERQKTMTAEERAYNDKVREQEFARRDAEIKRVAGIQAEQTAYERAQAELARNTQFVGGYADNYQAEINRRMAADPNDPMIPALMAARQEKLQTQKEDTRSAEIANVGQYSNDYQAEINRRQATPTKDDDWLIPYIAAARADKIQAQKEAEAKAQEDARKAAEAERIRKEKEAAAIKLKQTPGPTKPPSQKSKPVSQPIW